MWHDRKDIVALGRSKASCGGAIASLNLERRAQSCCLCSAHSTPVPSISEIPNHPAAAPVHALVHTAAAAFKACTGNALWCYVCMTTYLSQAHCNCHQKPRLPQGTELQLGCKSTRPSGLRCCSSVCLSPAYRGRVILPMWAALCSHMSLLYKSDPPQLHLMQQERI